MLHLLDASAVYFKGYKPAVVGLPLKMKFFPDWSVQSHTARQPFSRKEAVAKLPPALHDQPPQRLPLGEEQQA